jgi:hypothetical protein
MPAASIASLRRFTEAWALRLGLGTPDAGGWGISVTWATKADAANGLISDEDAGSCVWMIEHREANIYLNKRYAADLAELHLTIIHELLHIRLEGHLPRAKRYDPHYEHAINYLSGALRALAESNPGDK